MVTAAHARSSRAQRGGQDASVMATRRTSTRRQSVATVSAKTPKKDLAVHAAKAATANILTVVKPQARDRWQQLALQGMTPDRVQQIIRGVIAGSFTEQWALFDLMEDTWPRLKKNL